MSYMFSAPRRKGKRRRRMSAAQYAAMYAKMNQGYVPRKRRRAAKKTAGWLQDEPEKRTRKRPKAYSYMRREPKAVRWKGSKVARVYKEDMPMEPKAVRSKGSEADVERGRRLREKAWQFAKKKAVPWAASKAGAAYHAAGSYAGRGAHWAATRTRDLFLKPAPANPVKTEDYSI